MNWLDEFINRRRIHGEWAEMHLLREILDVARDNSGKLDKLLLQSTPRLHHISIIPQGGNVPDIQVGQTQVYKVVGKDQFGNDFALDLTANPPTWSADNSDITIAADPSVSTSEDVTGVTAGGANLSVSVAGLSASLALNVTQPAPVLTSVQIVSA